MKTINPPESSVATRQPDQPPVGITIQAAFEAASTGKLDEKSLQVMKELLAMSAEQAFNMAFVKLQSELPTIVAETVIPNRGKYARFEDVMRQIEKPLHANGFTVSFTQEPVETRINVTCILRHAAGHAERNTYAVRVSGKADSETQADCKASTTAKRNSLLQALNIVVRQDVFQDEDGDASLEGNRNEKVTEAQAFELERRVSETNSDHAAFLKFAGAQHFTEIPANRYVDLDAMLRRKERSGK